MPSWPPSSDRHRPADSVTVSVSGPIPEFQPPFGCYDAYSQHSVTGADISIDVLKNRPKDKPFFMMSHHKAPHREWTPENGRNNALRINGLGAPRAFYTPMLREIKVPNTSYGEDYALGLNFSREYQIGRIYDVLYLCRRWEGNSDAALDVQKLNANNLYKDKIRTIEMAARKRLNQQQN